MVEDRDIWIALCSRSVGTLTTIDIMSSLCLLKPRPTHRLPLCRFISSATKPKFIPRGSLLYGALPLTCRLCLGHGINT